MDTQQHLRRLFGDKISPQVAQEVDQLRRLWFQLKGRHGAKRIPGSLAAEWVGYSISAVSGTAQFRFFFAHVISDGADLLNLVVDAFPFERANVFGIKFSACNQGKAQGTKRRTRPVARFHTNVTGATQTIQAGMLLTVHSDTGDVLDGTLGAFLKDGISNIWVLSANHVLTANGFFTNQQIQFDGGKPYPVQQVRFARLLPPSDVNYADVAIAQLQPGLKLRADPPFLGAVSTASPSIIPSGSLVTRRGEGKLAHAATNGSDVEYAPELEYDSGDCGILDAMLEDQYLVKGNKGVAFSIPGDSGSLALYQNDVLGMVIANGETVQNIAENYTVVTPFDQVMESLNNNLDGGGSSLGLSLYQGPPTLIQ